LSALRQESTHQQARGDWHGNENSEDEGFLPALGQLHEPVSEKRFDFPKVEDAHTSRCRRPQIDEEYLQRVGPALFQYRVVVLRKRHCAVLGISDDADGMQGNNWNKTRQKKFVVT